MTRNPYPNDSMPPDFQGTPPLSQLFLAPWRILKRNDALAPDMRAAFAARPMGGFWIAALYGSLAGLLLNAAANPGTRLAFSHTQTPGALGLLIVAAWTVGVIANVLILPLFGGFVRWVLYRVLGANRPAEPCVLGTPSGALLAIASVSCLMLPFVAVAFLLIWQPWWPHVSAWLQGYQSHMAQDFGIGASVTLVTMVARVYGVPLRSTTGRRLRLYIIGPQLILALVGGLVALGLGLLHQRYKNPMALAQTQTLLTQLPLVHQASPVSQPTPTTPMSSQMAVASLDQACYGNGPMRALFKPAVFTATVLGQAHPAAVLAAIHDGERSANGRLDPQYIHSPRVIVHPDKARPDVEEMAVVPRGMTLAWGEQVVYETAYADPQNPCHYLPNRVLHRVGARR